jgi:hypothetical protein
MKLKKSTKEQAKKYRDTYEKLFNQLPNWKKLAIQEDSKLNKRSGLLVDFLTQVIYNAEHEEISFSE